MGQVTGNRDNEISTVNYMRQVSMFDPSDFEYITLTIAGLGNIGSHSALSLARMGLKNFRLWDFDLIESHNLSSQAYNFGDIGREKVASVIDMMKLVNPEAHGTGFSKEFTGKEMEGQIFISAVDSMEARRAICVNLPKGIFVIDGRMGGGQIEIWSQPVEEWAATLTKDGDTDPCGARYISYTSYIIAGLIANQVKRYLMKERLAKKILFHTNTLEIISEFPKAVSL